MVYLYCISTRQSNCTRTLSKQPSTAVNSRVRIKALPKLTEKVMHLLQGVDEACFQRDSMCDTACKQERYFVGTGLVCLETTLSNIFQLPE